MTDLLPRPPWAGYIWSDLDGIYVELPCPEGKMPVVTRYARTEAGFAKALALVEQCCNKSKNPPAPGYYRHGEAKVISIGPRGAVKSAPSLKMQPQAVQDAVARALKRMKAR